MSSRFRAHALLIAAALSFVPVHAVAQSRPVLLAVDSSIDEVNAAQARQPFERLPLDGEKTHWVDPDGRADNIAVAVLTGAGVLGAVAAGAHAQAERDASVRPVHQALAREGRLRSVFETAVRRSVEDAGHAVSRTVRSRPLNESAIGRGLALGEEPLVFALQPARGTPAVVLSWDDRRVLLAGDFRILARNETPRAMLLREQLRRPLRYVGRELPVGRDPVAYWASAEGAAFIAEVERGLALMLPLAWDPSVTVPKVRGRETTVLQVGGESRTFPGRLWKQEGDVAYLFTDDRGITIVATSAAP